MPWLWSGRSFDEGLPLSRRAGGFPIGSSIFVFRTCSRGTSGTCSSSIFVFILDHVRCSQLCLLRPPPC